MRILLGAVTIFVFILGANAHADGWPSRPVRLIVPTGPGSATDVMARLMANEVSRTVGGTVYVENLPGASGILAHQAAARAVPDGYTFLFTATSGMAVNPVTFKDLPYNPTTDFAAVAMVSDLGPQMASVHKDLPVKTLGELIAYAKNHSGNVAYAVDATAGAAVISGRLLNDRSGAGMTAVSYKSAAQMGQDVAAGRVPVMISSIAVARPFLNGDAIRPLAVFSGRRFPTMPDVPTVSESLPGVVLDGFFVVVAPARTPPEIITKLNAAIAEFLKTPEAPTRLADIGLATSGAGTPESTALYLAQEQARWRELAVELKIEPQ